MRLAALEMTKTRRPAARASSRPAHVRGGNESAGSLFIAPATTVFENSMFGQAQAGLSDVIQAAALTDKHVDVGGPTIAFQSVRFT